MDAFHTILQELAADFSGTLEDDLKTAYERLRGHLQALRDDSALLEDLVATFGERYPEQKGQIAELWQGIAGRMDEPFINEMFRLVEAGEAPRAQFEMNFFISSMEDEFNQFKPSRSQRHLSIYEPFDLFEYYVHVSHEIELKPTARDYAGLYKAYARVLEEANEWQEASEAYQQALLWNPYDVAAMLDLAELYTHLNQFGMCYAATINALRHAVRPKTLGQALYYLGVFYEQKGAAAVASDVYRAARYWHDDERVRAALTRLLGTEDLPTDTRETIDALLAAHNIGPYPDSHHVNALKALAAILKVAGAKDTAQTLYHVYDEVKTYDNE